MLQLNTHRYAFAFWSMRDYAVVWITLHHSTSHAELDIATHRHSSTCITTRRHASTRLTSHRRALPRIFCIVVEWAKNLLFYHLIANRHSRQAMFQHLHLTSISSDRPINNAPLRTTSDLHFSSLPRKCQKVSHVLSTLSFHSSFSMQH